MPTTEDDYRRDFPAAYAVGTASARLMVTTVTR